MFIGEFEYDLNKDESIGYIDGIKYYKAETVDNILYELSTSCIKWSIDDFEDIAINLEGDQWENYFDKDKFPIALIEMIEDHDAEIGINWHTVNHYLFKYCSKLIK